MSLYNAVKYSLIELPSQGDDNHTQADDNRIRDVLWRLSVRAVNRHIFWYNLRRGVRLRKFFKLQLAHRFQWFDQSLVLVIQHGKGL
jgi:hypothetical protein